MATLWQNTFDFACSITYPTLSCNFSSGPLWHRQLPNERCVLVKLRNQCVNKKYITESGIHRLRGIFPNHLALPSIYCTGNLQCHTDARVAVCHSSYIMFTLDKEKAAHKSCTLDPTGVTLNSIPRNVHHVKTTVFAVVTIFHATKTTPGSTSLLNSQPNGKLRCALVSCRSFLGHIKIVKL